MARTRNHAAHALRRDAFVDAAQRLIQAKGYEQMTIQDVLDELDTSRGAFYHYFDSKAALLDAVIERMVDDAIAAIEPDRRRAGPPRPHPPRPSVHGLAEWKTERTEFLLKLMETWLADENAIVREKFRRGARTRMTPDPRPDHRARRGRRRDHRGPGARDLARVLVSRCCSVPTKTGDRPVFRPPGGHDRVRRRRAHARRLPRGRRSRSSACPRVRSRSSTDPPGAMVRLAPGVPGRSST